MVLKKFTDGNILYASELNDNYAESFTLDGLNHIRQLIDRTGVYSAGYIDLWGEAYIDSNGRNNSVNTSTSTAKFNSNRYLVLSDVASSDTTSDPDSFTNPTYAFDNDESTYAYKELVGSSASSSWSLGKTFGAKYVAGTYINIKGETANNGTNSVICYLQTYNGSTWSNHTTLINRTEGGVISETYTGYIALNTTTQGLRIRFEISNTGSSSTKYNKAYLYTLAYSTTGSNTIIHTIPDGSFSSTVSKAIGVPFFYEWESGCDIQYKLTNTTEDSGWLSCGSTPTLSSFTAFTSSPTTLTVNLIPKSSNPTAFYPSLRGFAIRAV